VLFCVVCLIVVPLPPGKISFAVQLNNNNDNNNNKNNNKLPQSVLWEFCITGKAFLMNLDM
jgi:hypothetical protein